MIYNPDAFNLYSEMLKLKPTLDLSKGCEAQQNHVFVRDAIAFAGIVSDNPFEENTAGFDAFNDLRYFYLHTSERKDCPFKMRCARAAIEMVVAEPTNPYTDVEEPEDNPQTDVEEAEEVVAEVREEPTKIFGVVPAKRRRFGRKR